MTSKDTETIDSLIKDFQYECQDISRTQTSKAELREQLVKSIQKIIERDVIKAGIDYSMSKLGYSKEMMEAEERLRDIQAKALTKALYGEKK